MPIFYNDKSKLFSINTEHSTYQMKVEKYDVLTHLYYGERVSDDADLSYMMNRGSVSRASLYNEMTYEDFEMQGDSRYCPHAVRQEYSAFGIGDYRTSNFIGNFADGSRVVDLRYNSYKIVEGKNSLEGLPAVYANAGEHAQTLIITLKDKVRELYVELYYSVIDGHDEIMRSARIINRTGEVFFIETAMSFNLDIPQKDFDVITFYGKPNDERMVDRQPIQHGKISTESTMGITGSFSNNSLILCDHDANEDKGACYGATLMYSGNFVASAELDHVGRVRMTMGINPAGFRWKLEDGEAFTAPEAIIAYTNEGLGALSRGFHNLIRYNVCRGKFRDAKRPVLTNNWEATVFEFDTEKLVDIAREAKEYGVEMLVVDDGWFGHRDWDNTSLGDWFEDKKKLPGGMPDLCKKINDIGMKLGVWFEPEMISEDSELYRKHPDYCIQVPGRPPMRGRWELVLDMTRKDIRDCIFEQMSKILSSSPISYIKWDMNRNVNDVYSLNLPADRQGEFYHRYVLGVYELMERVGKAFPDVLIESCCGGGGRFDAGILQYAPQIWCSDNTDPAHRLKIQYGTSLIYPVSTMGAHVAYSPNINTYHPTSVFTRGVTSMAGTFGYELDPSIEDKKSKKEMALMTKLYKKHYKTINHGDYYRLLSPYEQATVVTKISAWQFVSRDKKSSLVAMVQVDNVNDGGELFLKLKGLDASKKYSLHIYYETRDDKIKPFIPWIEDKDLGVFTGEILMKAGAHLSLYRGDNMSTLIELKAK